MKRAADGEMVCHVHRFERIEGTDTCEDLCWDWYNFKYEILDFPPPPQGQQWHNPAGLNATQVGVHEGFRLMTNKEFGIVPADMEVFDGARWCQIPNITAWYSLNKATFRTKAPLPAPKAAEIVLTDHDRCEWAWMSLRKERGENLTRMESFIKGWHAAKEHFSKQP